MKTFDIADPQLTPLERDFLRALLFWAPVFVIRPVLLEELGQVFVARPGQPEQPWINHAPTPGAAGRLHVYPQFKHRTPFGKSFRLDFLVHWTGRTGDVWLIIECDGRQHLEALHRGTDRVRDDYFRNAFGWETVRVASDWIWSGDTASSVRFVLEQIGRLLHPSPS